MSEKIRVLIVDDSALMREAMKSILNSDPSIEVIGTARDGKEGIEKSIKLKPDVITMDLKMPIMSGLEAIEKIMQEFPIPIIVVSSMDIKVVIKALTIGAMDFVAVTQDIEKIAKDLIEKVKISSKVRPLKRMKARPVYKVEYVPKKEAFKIVAIGASTGGPQALQILLSRLPHDLPAGIVIVQHITPGFVEGLAEWLKFTSVLDIKVAESGEVLKTGTVLIAPDNHHLKIGDDCRISLSEDTDKAQYHVPSIDVMMESVADSYGKNAVGVIMTGMGRDGAKGIGAIKKSGGFTIAQDEKSSVIFGMNKVAIDEGGVNSIVSLENIADEIVKLVK